MSNNYNNYNVNKNFQDVMQMYRFVDTTSKQSPIRSSLPENRVRVHKKGTYNVVVFSTRLYDEFIKDGIKSLRLAENKYTGELAFVLTDQLDPDAHPLRLQKVGNKGAKRSVIQVASKPLVDKLCEILGADKDADSFDIEISVNNSVRPEVKFYTIQKI